MSPRRSKQVVDLLRQVLDDRRDREADLRPARVVGRNTDGTTQLLRLDSECVGRGPEGNEYEGQVVTLPAGPVYDRLGTSGIAVNAGAGSALALWIESLSPDSYAPGDSGISVTVTGRGFTEFTAIEFLIPETDWINTDVTIDDQTLLSETEITLVLSIASGAAAFERAAISYDSQASGVDSATHLRYRKPDAYGIGIELFRRERWFSYGNVGWDVLNQRLLSQVDYDTWVTRDAAHPTGTTIDKGFVSQHVSQAHRSELPPSGDDSTQPKPLLCEVHRYDRDESDPVGFYGPWATFEAIGVDPESGNFVVIWTLDSEMGPPFIWHLTLFDEHGAEVRSVAIENPSASYWDYGGLWQVVINQGTIYTIEPDPDHSPEAGELLKNRVVSRSVGLYSEIGEWLPGDDYFKEAFAVCPVPLISDPEPTAVIPAKVYVFYSELVDPFPGGPWPHDKTHVAVLGDFGLVEESTKYLNFGFEANPTEDIEGWHLSDHGGFLGGDVIFDRLDSKEPVFVAFGITPDTYDPGPPKNEDKALFRFKVTGSGVYVDQIRSGNSPVPFFRTDPDSGVGEEEYIGCDDWDWPNVETF